MHWHSEGERCSVAWQVLVKLISLSAGMDYGPNAFGELVGGVYIEYLR
jgi:hypothetical protein